MTDHPRNREPRPNEANLFDDIYVDETSTSGFDFLLVGGVLFPRRHSALFEQTIIEARSYGIPIHWPDGTKRELGWSNFSKGDLECYVRVVDAFHSFKRHLTLHEDIIFYSSVVDTRVQGRRYSGKGKGQLGFNREIYFHLNRIGRERPKRLFHVYPDERDTDMTMRELQLILNRGIRKNGDTRDFPYRRVQFRKSHDVQALQVSDIFLGAIAYRLNRHYDSKDASGEKKELCDYICKRGHVLGQLNSGIIKSKTWGNFRMWVRRHRRH